MPDFPTSFPGGYGAAGVIHLWDQNASLMMCGSVPSPAAATWPAANRAQYFPFIVEKVVTVYQIAWLNGATVSGNLDVGIYDALGNRLVSKGSTAMSGVSVLQAADITDTTLLPGVYFMAMNVDNTTATFWRLLPNNSIFGRIHGAQQQAVGSVTLPDPATFAVNTSAYLPQLALFLNSVG